MDEKLLPTTACTLDQEELARMMNRVYGTFGLPDLSSRYSDYRECYPKDLGVPVENIPTYKRVTMRYDQFFKAQPWGEKLSVSADKACNSLLDTETDYVKLMNDTVTHALRDCLKNINMEDTDMLGKSVEIKKVIYSKPATIVYWMDGDKTVVRCKDGDTYSKEVGLLMCLAKRVWGKNESGSNFNDYMRKYVSEEKTGVITKIKEAAEEVKELSMEELEETTEVAVEEK